MQDMVKMEERVREYIIAGINMHDYTLENDTNIFEEGLVNSLFAIELMNFLEKTFCIKVGMDDLDMSNFSSINSIKKFIDNKLKGSE